MTHAKTAPTIRFDIFIGGDINTAKGICRHYCLSVGLCVTVEPVSFIYTGGEEAGIRVGLLNYPRFPSSAAYLEERAMELAELLRSGLAQHSYSVAGPETTIWNTVREP